VGLGLEVITGEGMSRRGLRLGVAVCALDVAPAGLYIGVRYVRVIVVHNL